MVTAFVQVDVPDRSLDFQRIALEPGVPLIDRGHTTARLIRVWLGRFAAEPEWVDSQTIRFFLVDERGSRIDPSQMQLVNGDDLRGKLRKEVKALHEKLSQIQPRGRTEQAVFNSLRERFEKLERSPSEGALFRNRDSKGTWRLVWCWGYQRSESSIVPLAVCVKNDCRRLYLIRNPEEPKCTKCGTPKPVFRFPWKKLGLATACLLLIVALSGWRYLSTLPRSSIDGQVLWSGLNVPIAAADVRIESLGVSTVTDQKGRFHFEKLPAGSLEIAISAEGFPKHTLNQKLEQSQSASMPVELIGDGILHGRVVDAVSHYPLSGVDVRIAGTSESYKTDENGEFRREGWRRGTVHLKIEAIGYPASEQEIIEVNVDDTVSEFEVAGDARLIGRIKSSAQEQPLDHVIVRLEGCGQTAETDADGWYRFKRAPSGLQKIVAEKAGYLAQRSEKELVSGQERQVPFSLAGAAKISGHVSRAVDLTPMSNVDVVMVGTKVEAKTDDQGHFQLNGVSLGKCVISASVPGFVATNRELELFAAEEVEPLKFELVGDATIIGTIVDEVTKRPVSDAEVQLGGTPAYKNRSNANGQYRLAAVPSLPAKIEVRSSGYNLTSTDVNPAAREEINVSVKLRGNSTLTGIIKEQWFKKPVAGATVTFGETGIMQTTSEVGKFELQGLRGGAKHDIRVEATGFEPKTVTVETTAGPIKPLEITLSGTARQSGRVVSAIDESPISRTLVHLVDSTLEAMTDANGQFTLDQLPIVVATIEVSSDGYETRRVSFDVTPDAKPMQIALDGNALVTGELKDFATGLPIADAEIEIEIAEKLFKTQSTKLGTYELKSKSAGRSTLKVVAEGYPVRTETINFSAKGKTKADLILTGTASLAGEIYDESDNPVENAIVRLDETEHQVTTGPRGDFQLDKLRAGIAKFSVTAPRFMPQTFEANLKPDKVNSQPRVKLSSSLILRGQVDDLLTGLPLENAKLTIRERGASTSTNAAGQFQFKGLPETAHQITIELPGYVSEFVHLSPSIDDVLGRVFLCPQPKQDEIFIALAWRTEVHGLGVHFYRTTGGKTDAHVFDEELTSDNISILTPRQNTVGRETLRIHPLKPGRYELVVSMPSDMATSADVDQVLKQLSQSEASVKVYRHGQAGRMVSTVGKNKKATVWQPYGLEILESQKMIEHIYKAEHYRKSLPLEIRTK